MSTIRKGRRASALCLSTECLFPTIVVASDNDIYIRAEQARDFAMRWGARFVLLHEAGHINVQSGHGEWPEGYEWVQSLRAMA